MLSNWEIARKIQEDLKRAEARVGKEAVRIYRRAYDELEKDITRFLARISRPDGTVGIDAVVAADRAVSLRGQIEKVMSDMAGEVEGLLNREVDKAAMRYLEKYAGSVEAVLPPGMAVQLNRFWPEVATAILNRRMDGVHFSERLGAIAPEVAEEMLGQLTIGAIRGEGIHPLMVRLQRTADIGRYRAEMIARTEIIRAHNAACDWTYAQYGGLVQAKRRLVTLDTRTCIACLAQDGKLYRLDEPMDDHVMGRCTFTAVLPEWGELGYDGEVPAHVRRARDPYTQRNKLLDFMDGRTWFEGLPAEVQMRMMGPSRWELWRRGYLGWDDLYGPGSSIVPVRNLKNVVGAP